GLEAVRVVDYKKKTIDITVRIKAVNNSTNSIYPVTDQQMNDAMNSFEQMSEQTFSGETNDGYMMKTDVIIDPEATLLVDFVPYIETITFDDNSDNLGGAMGE